MAYQSYQSKLKPYYHDSHATLYHADSNELLPELPNVDLIVADVP